MCIAAVGAIVGVLSSVASFGAAQADYNAKAQQWKQNFTNAMASGVEDQKKLNLRMVQEADQFAQKRHLTEVEGAEAQAKAETSAAEGNVGGISVQNILLGLQRDVDRNQQATQENYQNTVLQLQAQNESTTTDIENKINSVQRPVAPSPLGYIASGIGGVLNSLPAPTAA
jgi:hypothetical protein